MRSTDHPALTLLKELLSVPSPGGREERIAAIVRGRLEDAGYSRETDSAGNVIVRFAGQQPDLPLMAVAAHLDEIGMVVTAINPDGTLSVDRSGRLYPYKLGECAVDIIGDDGIVTGVTSMGSTHTADADRRQITWRDVRIFTGFSTQQLAERGIRPGSTAVPVAQARGPYLLGEPGDPFVAAWTLDDRGGILTLIRLLQNLKAANLHPHHPTIVAFTVHEEGGCHGAKVLAHRERPEIFLAIDGCPILPGSQMLADERPCTWSMDAKGHYDQRLIRDLHAAAREAGIELQTAVLPNAYSDASAVYDSGAAPRVAILGHGRENSHGFEIAKLRVFDNLLNVLEQFIRVAH
jgi:putative aminopeptidase FrvX